MNKTIILTKEKREGFRLKAVLEQIALEFSDIQVLTSGDLQEPQECRYIFSTWYMPVYSEEDVKRIFPNLECVFYAAGTVKYFAEPFLNNGVRVFSAAAANGIPVAEFVAAQIVLANKGYFQAANKYRKTVWTFRLNISRHISEFKSGNFNSSVGIIGCGAIGSKVVELLRPYNLKIFVYDPYVSNQYLKTLGATRSELNTIFRECDVISNHLPDVEETRGMINYSLLSQMRPWATFINTGRGRQVVEKDLAKVMKKNKGMCALLDVTAHEPIFPWSPLYYCKNVFLTPHIAGSLSNEYGRMVQYMYDAYRCVLDGTHSPYEIIGNLSNIKA